MKFHLRLYLHSMVFVFQSVLLSLLCFGQWFHAAVRFLQQFLIPLKNVQYTFVGISIQCLHLLGMSSFLILSNIFPLSTLLKHLISELTFLFVLWLRFFWYIKIICLYNIIENIMFLIFLKKINGIGERGWKISGRKQNCRKRFFEKELN